MDMLPGDVIKFRPDASGAAALDAFGEVLQSSSTKKLYVARGTNGGSPSDGTNPRA
jgi:hypothetical protein